jgi:hypothetical protein
MTRRHAGLPLIVALACAGMLPIFGQTLQVSVTANGATRNVAAGGTITLWSRGVGRAAVATVLVANSGASAVTVTSVMVAGSPMMKVVGPPAFPMNLSPGAFTSFNVQSLPFAAGKTTGQVSIAFIAGGQSSLFDFNLSGTTADLVFSYFLPPAGALTGLNPGDRITFPATNVGSSATATITIMNRGSAPVAVPPPAVSGADFVLANSPASLQLAGGQQATFNVNFTPHGVGPIVGTLTMGLGPESISFGLAGTGATPNVTASYAFADGNIRPLSNGTTITFPAVDINGTVPTGIEILNQGLAPVTVASIAVSGAAFALVSLPLLPATLGPGQALHCAVTFAPTQAGTFTGTLVITVNGASISSTLSGSTASATLALTYVDANNSTFNLQDGSTISFPDTPTSGTSTVTLAVTNTGKGTGSVSTISLAGDNPAPYLLLGLPTLPVLIAPNQQLRVGLRFSPPDRNLYSATLLLNVNGQSVTINLKAQGIAPLFTYSWSNGGDANAFSAGDTISIADTAIGNTTSLTVTISNAGNTDGQVSAIAVSGQGFSVTDVPPLPFTIKPNGVPQQFTMKFAPTEAGAATGRLVIGSDAFNLKSNGIGSKLIYTSINPGSSVSVADGGSVIFAPLAVGSTESMDFSIQNAGNSAATISSINLASASTIFSLKNLPTFPMNLAVGSTVTFSATFAPNNVGSLTATLRINSASFLLSGIGTPPPTLSEFQFQGPSGVQQPSQQPAVGLSLSAPYALDLQGTITLTFLANGFVDDPAIQFANGGRVAKFTIPANTMDALFSNNGNRIPLQTGTVAGNIVLTPAFTLAGGYDLTPTAPTTSTITISASAPQLLSASVASPTLSTFTVVISGFSTTRTVTKLDVQLTPKPGVKLDDGHLTLDTSAAATAWFQSSTSQQSFGGLFLMAIPITLHNGSTRDDLVHQLQSAVVTATNEVGTSASVTAIIQ